MYHDAEDDYYEIDSAKRVSLLGIREENRRKHQIQDQKDSTLQFDHSGNFKIRTTSIIFCIPLASHEPRCVFRNTNGPGTRLWSDRGRMWHIDSSHKEKIDHAIVYHVPGEPPEGPTCMYFVL